MVLTNIKICHKVIATMLHLFLVHTPLYRHPSPRVRDRQEGNYLYKIICLNRSARLDSQSLLMRGGG